MRDFDDQIGRSDDLQSKRVIGSKRRDRTPRLEGHPATVRFETLQEEGDLSCWLRATAQNAEPHLITAPFE